jgi:hypothetical protein
MVKPKEIRHLDENGAALARIAHPRFSKFVSRLGHRGVGVA